MRSLPTLVCAWALTPSLVPAQGTALIPATLRVPIHTHAGDPAFGPYGLWAAGTDYKASFHDGFAFYPRLGPDHPENLPLVWHTESVTVGGKPMPGSEEQGTTRRSDWRFEIHHPGLVEAYDVRAEGVEQTFALAQRPALAGDWVVTGRVTTLLRAAAKDSAHQELVFADDLGIDRVRYGAATAIDAAGDRLPVTTQFDGQRIRLTVPGDWLATARFPVLLDPLTSAVVVSSGLAADDIDIATSGTFVSDSTMVVFTRTFSGADRDAYAIRTSTSFTPTYLVFQDISASLIAEKTSVALALTDWVVAFQRTSISGSQTLIRALVHPRDDTTPNGTLLFLGPTVSGATDRNPDVGGGDSTGGFIVYQSDITTTNANTPNTEVYIVSVIANTLTFGTPVTVAAVDVGTRYDRENPAINQYSSVVSGTLNLQRAVVWQELDRGVANDDWDIVAKRIGTTGPIAGEADLTASVAATSHKVRPKVDGHRGRFMATYLLATSGSASSAPELRTVRFDTAGSPIAVGSSHTLRTSTITLYSEPQIAHDRSTGSHWAVAWQQRSAGSPAGLPSAVVARVGYTGGQVEAATMAVNPAGVADLFHPAVTWAVPTLSMPGRFLAAYATPGLPPGVSARTLEYDPAAVVQRYGVRCGTADVDAGRPYAGNERFPLELSFAPPFATAIAFLSAGQGDFPLDASGMTGCRFLLSPTWFMPIVTAANAAGEGLVEVSLPDRPAFFGELYFQWIYLSFGANPAGLQATRGLRASVR